MQLAYSYALLQRLFERDLLLIKILVATGLQHKNNQFAHRNVSLVQ